MFCDLRTLLKPFSETLMLESWSWKNYKELQNYCELNNEETVENDKFFFSCSYQKINYLDFKAKLELMYLNKISSASYSWAHLCFCQLKFETFDFLQYIWEKNNVLCLILMTVTPAENKLKPKNRAVYMYTIVCL